MITTSEFDEDGAQTSFMYDERDEAVGVFEHRRENRVTSEGCEIIFLIFFLGRRPCVSGGIEFFGDLSETCLEEVGDLLPESASLFCGSGLDLDCPEEGSDDSCIEFFFYHKQRKRNNK